MDGPELMLGNPGPSAIEPREPWDFGSGGAVTAGELYVVSFDWLWDPITIGNLVYVSNTANGNLELVIGRVSGTAFTPVGTTGSVASQGGGGTKRTHALTSSVVVSRGRWGLGVIGDGTASIFRATAPAAMDAIGSRVIVKTGLSIPVGVAEITGFAGSAYIPYLRAEP